MAMIEVKLQPHMLIQHFDAPGFGRISCDIKQLKSEIENWLKERLGRRVEAYLTSDEYGNWYHAINFRPEESTTAVEFKIRWS